MAEQKQTNKTTKQKPKNIGEVLVRNKALSVDTYKKVVREKSKSETLTEALIRTKSVSEGQLADGFSQLLGVPIIKGSNIRPRRDALNHISYAYAQKHKVLPLRVDKGAGILYVAMTDPMDYAVIDHIELTSKYTVKIEVSTRTEILTAINKHYATQAAGTIQSSDTGTSEGGQRLDSAVVELLEHILVSAIQLKASDIHFDPEVTYTSVRYRVDGELREVRKLQAGVHERLVARIKILSALDITQTRAPQDGRFNTTLHGVQADMRVSSLPTVNGEKIVIRILDASDADRKIKELGFADRNYENYMDLLKRPSGLVLVTGPTGSGKSSTLYASIQEVNQANVNVMTVEDPVELHLEGINQVQVRSDVGLTFAAGLRSILRQDPNIIMIGEIRDQETAEIAIRSALTGHLVLSTLHTNSAIDAIPRLMDMGVEPYMVASSVKGIVAQRLVRRVCADCKVERDATPGEQAIFKDRGYDIQKVAEGKGCNTCGRTGYKGRMAIHEVVMIDDTMKRMVLESGQASALRDYAKSSGVKFLLDDGLDKIQSGDTTLEEVMKIAADA